VFHSPSQEIPLLVELNSASWIDAMENKYPLHHAKGMPASLAVSMYYNYNET